MAIGHSEATWNGTLKEGSGLDESSQRLLRGAVHLRHRASKATPRAPTPKS